MIKKVTDYKKKDSAINSNCGVFGIYNNPEAGILTYYGLHSLQHRGQEAAGIVSSEFLENENRYRFNIHKDHGLVSNVFRDEKILTDVLKGSAAIGHTRYSTTGASDKRTNIQPFKVIYKGGNLALSHNGNLTNTRELRTYLQNEGTLFQTSTDSELLLHLIARSKKESIEEKILEAVSFIRGAYSICILTDDKLFAIRDPYGVRPFCMGQLDDSFIFASETCALDIVNAEYVRDVMPGEMVIIDKEVVQTQEPKSIYFHKVDKYRHCIFEYIYFSRPDSVVFEEKVDKVRRRIGKNLAIESPPPPKEDDKKRVVIINVPDSSNTATLGYFSEASKTNKDVKNEIGLIRSHYVGRTFIQPGQDKREMKVRTKFNIVKGVLADRKVVMIDDSIVRGTTSRLLVDLLKKAKPKEIHLKITSPPIISPCYYGMDFPSKGELIANQKHQNIEEIRDYLGVTSLAYLTEEKLLDGAPKSRPETGFCTACFTGQYPIQIEGIDDIPKNGFDD